MIVYLLNSAIIILAGIIFFVRPRNSKNNTTKNIYLVFVGLVLIIISGFRGDFSSDYVGYEEIFKFHNQFSDFRLLLKYKYNVEIGYILVNWLIGRFTDNTIWIFLMSSIIILSLHLKEIKKNSSNICLSVLLFATIGAYYTSFNIMRQILAVSIIFSGSSYLYEKKIWNYIAVVLLASLFHSTALLMIPFYFILNFKFNYKNLAILLITLILISSNIHVILEFAQKYFYSHYKVSSYGMSGYGYKNIILPLGILFFIISEYSKNGDKENKRLNVWFNATIFYVFFSFLGLNIQMLERFSYYFSPYILLIIPKMVSNERNKHLRTMYYFVIVLVAILYNLFTLSGSGYNPYYFIWNR